MGSVFQPGAGSGCLGTSMSHFLSMVAPGPDLECRWDRQPILTHLMTPAATLEPASTQRTSPTSPAWYKMTTSSWATSRCQNHRGLSFGPLRVSHGMFVSGGRRMHSAWASSEYQQNGRQRPALKIFFRGRQKYERKASLR